MGKVPPQLEEHAKKLAKESSRGLGLKHGKSKPVSVMLPPDLDEIVRSMPDRSEWIRQAIREKLDRERES